MSNYRYQEIRVKKHTAKSAELTPAMNQAKLDEPPPKERDFEGLAIS